MLKKFHDFLLEKNQNESEIIDILNSFVLSEFDDEVNLKKKSLILKKIEEKVICPNCGSINKVERYDCNRCSEEIILSSDEFYIKGAWQNPCELIIINSFESYQHYQYILKSGLSSLGIEDYCDVYIFESNQIKGDIISQLSNDSIKQLNFILEPVNSGVYSIWVESKLSKTYFIGDVDCIESLYRKSDSNLKNQLKSELDEKY